MRFKFVRKILELTPGQSISAETFLGSDEELFEDHFPGFPVIPGVLLVEMMGQAAAQCIVAGDPECGLVVLSKINSASFRGWVRPDEIISLNAEVTQKKSRFAMVSCRALVDGAEKASASLMMAFVQGEQAQGLRTDDEPLKRYFESQS